MSMIHFGLNIVYGTRYTLGSIVWAPVVPVPVVTGISYYLLLYPIA